VATTLRPATAQRQKGFLLCAAQHAAPAAPRQRMARREALAQFLKPVSRLPLLISMPAVGRPIPVDDDRVVSTVADASPRSREGPKKTWLPGRSREYGSVSIRITAPSRLRAFMVRKLLCRAWFRHSTAKSRERSATVMWNYSALPATARLINGPLERGSTTWTTKPGRIPTGWCYGSTTSSKRILDEIATLETDFQNTKSLLL
jgi:hypothetical protein